MSITVVYEANKKRMKRFKHSKNVKTLSFETFKVGNLKYFKQRKNAKIIFLSAELF